MRAREWGLAGLTLTALGVFMPAYKVILFGDVSLFDLYKLSAIGSSGRSYEALIILGMVGVGALFLLMKTYGFLKLTSWISFGVVVLNVVSFFIKASKPENRGVEYFVRPNWGLGVIIPGIILTLVAAGMGKREASVAEGKLKPKPSKVSPTVSSQVKPRRHWGLLIFLILILSIGGFIALPILSGYVELQGFEPKAVNKLLLGIWDYWVQVVGGFG